MPFLSLSSSSKQSRAAALIASIGGGATMTLYTGSPPASPDNPATGTLLAAFTLSSPAAIASYTVQSLTIANAGTLGSSGVQTVVGTTGTGTPFQAIVTVSGGSIIAASLVRPGIYSVPPTALVNEPVTGGGLVGATLGLIMTAQISFNPITPTNGLASGNAGYARIANTAGHGVIDLDCGTFAASVLMNTTQVIMGSPVVCSSEIIIEG